MDLEGGDNPRPDQGRKELQSLSPFSTDQTGSSSSITRSGGKNFLHRGTSDSLVLQQHSENKKKSWLHSILYEASAQHIDGFDSRITHQEDETQEKSSPDFNPKSREKARKSSANLEHITSIALFPSFEHTTAGIISSMAQQSRRETEIQPCDRDCQESDDNNSIYISMPKADKPLPIALKYVDVHYHIAVQGYPKFGFHNLQFRKLRKQEKHILYGITGYALPGEVMALMGPSGSGKTTLINLLSGRLKVGSGTISYNDMPYSKALKRRMGFVMQDDLLYPHLTVQDTLTYAALLRLPRHFTKKKKVERAREVIQELGLERCQDSIIGGPFLRGISGGERKRVSVGHEILIDPSVLYLDEPTSGLDSTTALRMIKMLRQMSQGGRTIVLTIHQPSSRLFYMFDRLMVLSEGRMVYFGKAASTMEYFSSIGFSPLITMNPADFLLDLANGNVSDVSIPNDLMEARLDHSCSAVNGPDEDRGDNTSMHKPSSKDVKKYLFTSFETTLEPTEKHNLLELGISCELKEAISIRREWCSLWWSQFLVLFVRGQRERCHDHLSFLKIFQHILSALIMGTLWFKSNLQTDKDVTDQVALLFFISAYWSLVPLNGAIQSFCADRTMLAKERASDMYRLSAYLVARTLADIPLQLCLPSISITIVYFMAQLRMTVATFFLTLLTIWLTVITSQGLGIAIGSTIMDLRKALTLGTTIVLTFTLAGGFFIQRMPHFISWIKYVCFNYHTFKMLLKVQYDSSQLYNCIKREGCESITQTPILHGVSLEGGMNEAIIVILMVVAYHLVAYFSLRRMNLSIY